MSAQGGTLDYVVQADTTASIPGVGAHVPIADYQGNTAGLSWDMVSGTWYYGPGEAVINTADPASAGLATGQTIHMTVAGKPVTVRITGEAFVPGPTRSALLTSSQTPGSAARGLAITQYIATSRPGASAGACQAALQRALGPGYLVNIVVPGQTRASGFSVLSIFPSSSCSPCW